MATLNSMNLDGPEDQATPTQDSQPAPEVKAKKPARKRATRKTTTPTERPRDLFIYEKDNLEVVKDTRVYHHMTEQAACKVEDSMEYVLSLDYWSAGYQAVEPFLRAYAYGGSSPAFCRKYADAISDKLDTFTVDEGDYTWAYKAFRSIDRTTASLLLPDITDEDCKAYANVARLLCGNETVVRGTIRNSRMFGVLFQSLLQIPEGEDYSPNLVYAAYLYRRGNHDAFDAMLPDAVAELRRQLGVYADKFTYAFNEVKNFVEEDNQIYQWYCDGVRDAIANAWRYGAGGMKGSDILSTQLLYSLPQWVSEQLKAYLVNHPIYNEMTVSSAAVFDIMQYSLLGERTLDDPFLVHIFTLDPRRVTAVLDKLREDYWAIKEGAHVKWMRTRYQILYQRGVVTGYATPADYDNSLRLRGFDLTGGNGNATQGY